MAQHWPFILRTYLPGAESGRAKTESWQPGSRVHIKHCTVVYHLGGPTQPECRGEALHTLALRSGSRMACHVLPSAPRTTRALNMVWASSCSPAPGPRFLYPPASLVHQVPHLLFWVLGLDLDLSVHLFVLIHLFTLLAYK